MVSAGTRQKSETLSEKQEKQKGPAVWLSARAFSCGAQGSEFKFMPPRDTLFSYTTIKFLHTATCTTQSPLNT
jgi:hypothetical protein